MKIHDIASYDSDLISDQCPEKVLRSPGAIALPLQADVQPVAEMIEKLAHEQVFVDVVLAVDDTGNVKGVIDPLHIVEAVNNYRGMQYGSFLEAVNDLNGDPNEAARQYHHEWLNEHRTGSYWCTPYNHFSCAPVCRRHNCQCDPMAPR